MENAEESDLEPEKQKDKELLILMHMEGEGQENDKHSQISEENEKENRVIYPKSETSIGYRVRSPDIEYERQLGSSTHVNSPSHSTLTRHRFRRNFEPRYFGSEVYYDQALMKSKSLSSVPNNNKEFLDTQINYRFMFLLSRKREAGKSSLKKHNPPKNEVLKKSVTFAPETQFVERDEERPFWRGISERKERRQAMLLSIHPTHYKKRRRKHRKEVQKVNKQYVKTKTEVPILPTVQILQNPQKKDSKKNFVGRISSFFLGCLVRENSQPPEPNNNENNSNAK